jgi:hypothetical protein
MPSTPTYGQVYNNGVKYIKINRYDSGGLDRSDYLSQLQSITLTYPDRSAIEYPITTIQEQANFYLYGITPGYNTSSAGEILNYKLDARKSYATPYLISSSVGIFPPTPLEISSIIGYTSTPTDILSYFTTSTGKYTFGNTPNLNNSQLYFSASFWVTGSGTGGTYVNVNSFILLERNGVIAGAATGVFQTLVNFSDIIGGNELQISSSFTLEQGVVTNFLEGDSLILAVCTTQPLALSGGSNVSLIKQLKFELSQSVSSFNGSSSLTIFDPDTLNFDYNDYNPLLGNADIPQFSTVWMDVDYSQNPLTPVNFGLIISGTADRAFVQDSNYSSKAWSNLRYNGSRTNSYRIIE